MAYTQRFRRARVKEYNKFERSWFLERTGERRLSYFPRDRNDMLESRKLRAIITDDYIDFVHFHAKSFIDRITSVSNSSKAKENFSRYFDYDIKSIITDWNRFISICKYYSNEKNFIGKKISKPPILYNLDSNSFYWQGIGAISF